MKFSTEYGYLIKALREYPFNEQIKRRCEEIEYPLRKSDINSGIKTNYHENNPKVLLDLIKKESDPILHKYQLYSKAIDLAKSKLTLKEWALIEDVYIKNSTNVDNAAFKYFQRGKDFAYDKIIKPFFSEIERNIFELSASEKFSFKISDNWAVESENLREKRGILVSWNSKEKAISAQPLVAFCV